MTFQLTFMCAPGGDATLDPFLGDAPLSEQGLRAAREAAMPLPAQALVLRAPSIRCAQTADSLGLTAVPEPALRDLDLGDWDGRNTEILSVTDPYGLSAWRTDPDATPHTGESVRGFCCRVGDWLSSMATGTGQVVAVTEAAIIRAALVHALGTPTRSFWHLAIPPLSAVSLTWQGGWCDVRCTEVMSVEAPHRSIPRGRAGDPRHEPVPVVCPIQPVPPRGVIVVS